MPAQSRLLTVRLQQQVADKIGTGPRASGPVRRASTLGSAMTSEAFVYIALPGETTFVTAGRLVLVTDRHGVVSGHFVYGRSYLARPNAVPLDPIELPLKEETFTTTRLKGVFGALRDAGPDYRN